MKALAATLALALAAGTAGAEEPASLVSGDKVRLTLPDGRWFTGALVVAEGDTLLVRVGAHGPTTRVPLADLERVEVARGRRGHFKEGALMGFVPGFGLGAWVGHAFGCYEHVRGCSAVGYALWLGTITGGITGLAGGLMGLAVRTDRWVDVPVGQPRPRVDVSLLPVRQGTGARLAVSF